jgi:hypothetical protein
MPTRAELNAMTRAELDAMPTGSYRTLLFEDVRAMDFEYLLNEERFHGWEFVQVVPITQPTIPTTRVMVIFRRMPPP